MESIVIARTPHSLRRTRQSSLRAVCKKIKWIAAACGLAMTMIFPVQAEGLKQPLANPYPAPEFAGIESWLNSTPLSMASLKGKVVLVDIWTYSCINCIRTLPSITQWDAAYRDKGLVIVGVHAPEFAFEKSEANVKAALAKYSIRYPVALDNEMQTWNAFKNRYWPAHYLIDKQGRVVYKHFGEGNYDITEHNIRFLLGLDGKAAAGQGAAATSAGQTPETYLGTARAKNFVDSATLEKDQWTLSGMWERLPDRIVAQEAGATLRMHFSAGKVFLVLGAADGKPVKAMLTLDGKPITSDAGRDAPHGVLTVDQHALYEIVNLNQPGERLLEIKSEAPGLEAYAFTFGR
ncbi:MAG: thioredoxin family protein [Alphaproteobacteria bacterium]|nr:thioredoxin family protein [Alphaproteobacteria bacterium]